MSGQIVAKNCEIWIGGREFSTDFNSVVINRSVETPENTRFNAITRTRLAHGLRDWSIVISGLFNDQSGRSEERFQYYLRTSNWVVISIFQGGTGAEGLPAYEGAGFLADYSVESPVEGLVALASTWLGRSIPGVPSPPPADFGQLRRAYISTPLTFAEGGDSGTSVSRDFGSTGSVRAVLQSGSQGTDFVEFSASIQHSTNNADWSTLFEFNKLTGYGSGSSAQLGEYSGGQRYVRSKWENAAGAGDASVEFVITVGQF